MSQTPLLLVSYSFPPSNAPAAQRAYAFAKYLPENQVQPVVLTTTANISSLGYGKSMDTSNMTLLDTAKNANRAAEVETPKATSKQLVKNSLLKKIIGQFLIPDRGIIWLPAALKAGSAYLKAHPEVEWIFATAPSFTNLVIAIMLGKRHKRKVITDFRDFYVMKGLFKRAFPLFYIDRFLERWIIKNSAHVIFISKSMKAAYESAYPVLKQKSTLIYNGFDEIEYTAFQQTTAVDANLPKVRIFFAGSLYFESTHPRNIFDLLNGLQALVEANEIDRNELEIKLAAFIHPNLMEQLNTHTLFDKVKLLGVIKREEVFVEMQKSNLLWHMLGDSEQDRSAIPIKTFEYMASGKKVVFFVPKGAELEEIIQAYELGFTCYLGNQYQQTNTRAIKAAYDYCCAGAATNGSVLKSDRFKKFKRDYQAEQLAELIKKA